MKLTATSVIVLGLVEAAGEATPYELKQAVAVSVGNFWSIPHSQLYAEPDRLAEGGLLKRRQEEAGRRRKTYSLTARGRTALDRWRREPTHETAEMRDPGLLKVFFGADPAEVARAQLAVHRAKLAGFEARRALDDGSGARGPWIALEAGVRHTLEWIAYWEEIAETGGIRPAPLGRHGP